MIVKGHLKIFWFNPFYIGNMPDNPLKKTQISLFHSKYRCSTRKGLFITRKDTQYVSRGKDKLCFL